MTDMTLEQVRDELRRPWNQTSAFAWCAQLADAIDAHLAKAAQPVEALDVRTAFERWASAKGYALHIRDMKGSTRLGEYGYADTQRLWETWQAALAHPRPTVGSWSVKVPAARMEEAILSMQGPDGEALDGTLWLGQLDDGAYGVHLSCDECPEEGSITLAVLPAPTGEQAGEVVGRMVVHEDPLVEANYGITSWKQEVIAKMPPGEYPLCAQPRPTVPEGYRLVPVESTDDMCRNAREKIGIGSNVAHHVWHWMIAAAPDGDGVS